MIRNNMKFNFIVKIVTLLLLVGGNKFVLAQIKEDGEVKPPNNVCSTYEDYFTINTSKNCWYNPDINTNPEEVILKNGYPLEKYDVTTDDGYILDLFRLPQKESNKGILFLQHPATIDYSVWVLLGKNFSFAYIFYDAGYDVWMGNARGTEYGRKHLTLDPEDKKFWDFSYHEMGIYDLPAMINFIQTKTNNTKKITAIGHSMGGTSLAIYAAMLPNHAKNNLNLIITISPALRFKHIRSISVKFITSIMTPNIKKLLEDVGLSEIVRQNGPVHSIRKLLCNAFPAISHFACFAFDVFSAGMSYESAPELQPIAHTMLPVGLSLKTLFHFAQSITSGNFSFYDYGREKNLELYGQEIPPVYPLKNISVPFFMIVGTNDTLTTLKDLKDVYNDLPEIAKKYGYLEVKQANHYDTIYSKYIRKNIQEPIIKLLERIN